MLNTRRFWGQLVGCLLLTACATGGASLPDDLTLVSASVIRGSATPPSIKIDGEYYPGFSSAPFLTVTLQSAENLFEPPERRQVLIPHATYCRDWREYTSVHHLDHTHASPPSMDAAPVVEPDLPFEKIKSKEDYQAAYAEWEQRRPFTYEIYLLPQKPLGTGYVPTRAYDLRSDPDDVCIGLGRDSLTDADQFKLIVVPKAAISQALAKAAEKKR
jgi:hypothetical protein